MIDEIQGLLDRYVAWLRDKTSLRQVNDWVEITTPFLDRHNDYIQIYARRGNGSYLLTDDGYTLDDLARSGCKVDSPKRQALLKMTLGGFGVQLKDSALEVRASAESFAQRKHNLVQAMLAVNDMFCLATPVVASLFHEDVASWLGLHDIRYTPDVSFRGKMGYDYHFHFVIPKSRRQPERVLRAINRPSRETAQSMVLAWIDTRETRPVESRAYALLNDSERDVPADVIGALRSYDVRAVPWSRREEVREELAA
jgi:hypothetical protein